MAENDRTNGARASGPVAGWLPPFAFAALIVALAPFVGVLRESVQDAFGLGYLRWVTAGLALAGAVAVVWALLRIGERRAVRYGLLAVAAVLVALQAFGWGTGEAEVDTVERVHLVEYGLLAALFERALRRRHCGLLLPVLTVAAVALVGLADEWIQWLTPVRVGDGRDVLLNAWAGVIGYLFAVALSREGGRLRRPGRESRRLAAGLGAVLVLAAGAFFDTAHLGYEIHDPRAGSFVSLYSPEELLRVAAERRVRWAAEGRPPRRPLALEDAFLTEAGWHARTRNEAVERGDLLEAWRENGILERWYVPFLELPGSRWPPPQLEAIEAAVRQRFRARPELVDDGSRYRSPALRNRVLPAPPRSLLWAGVTVLAAVLAWVAWRHRAAAGDPSKMESS